MKKARVLKNDRGYWAQYRITIIPMIWNQWKYAERHNNLNPHHKGHNSNPFITLEAAEKYIKNNFGS